MWKYSDVSSTCYAMEIIQIWRFAVKIDTEFIAIKNTLRLWTQGVQDNFGDRKREENLANMAPLLIVPEQITITHKMFDFLNEFENHTNFYVSCSNCQQLFERKVNWFLKWNNLEGVIG